MKKKEEKTKQKLPKKVSLEIDPKQMRLIVAVVIIFGITIGIYDFVNGELSFDDNLKRRPYGQGESEENLVVRAGEDQKEQVTVKISEQTLSEEEAYAYIEMAEKEIDETIQGENASLEQVTTDLVLKESYVNGYVDASWAIKPAGIISRDGEIHYDEITGETLVELNATLTCSDYEIVYTIAVNVTLPEMTQKEGFRYYLSKALQQADESNQESEEFVLPREIDNLAIRWQRPRQYRGPEIVLLGVVLGILSYFGRKEEVRRKKREKVRKLEEDYPEIVSALSLYVSAGISVKSSFERIAAQYRKKKDDSRASPMPGYEAILACSREMEDGVSETEAYRRFGRRCDHRSYNKLAMMLVQNVRKGNRQLKEQLEKEEAESFEARKIRARILGEEASTKLLLPMGMLLGVVLIVTIAPAMMNMSY